MTGRRESESEAHQIFREHPGHADSAKTGRGHVVPGIAHPGSTGVIYVMDRAAANGFEYATAKENGWSNFGQGAPEVGPIPGAVERPTMLDFAEFGEGIHEYAPTNGVMALRKAVANYYNVTYRTGKESQYTADNICIVPGGRAGLSRIASVISSVNVGCVSH